MIEFIKDLGIYQKNGTKARRRYWLVKCLGCNKEMDVVADSIKSGNTTKCRSCAARILKTTHNGTRTKIYGVWIAIKMRCYRKSFIYYKNYGGRGIKVCSEWLDDFVSFRDWALDSGYKEGLTIDRINNDGDYEPSNCRFITRGENTRNGRLLTVSNKSGYRGVFFHSYHNKWCATVTYKKLKTHIGYFTNPKEAAIARDNYVKNHEIGLPLNFEMA